VNEADGGEGGAGSLSLMPAYYIAVAFPPISAAAVLVDRTPHRVEALAASVSGQSRARPC
jgi:hypothetical protein